MTHRGLLLTMTEPPAGMEEEFNAWYDDEHMAERLSIPGFLSARRWVADCRPGEGKYLATYELESLAVLHSEKYLFHYKNQTAWSRRCLGKCVVFRRWACEQVEPGDADPDPRAKALLLVAGASPAMRVAVGPALLERRFTASEGPQPHVALFELAEPREAIAHPGKEGLVRLYRAYG